MFGSGRQSAKSCQLGWILLVVRSFLKSVEIHLVRATRHEPYSFVRSCANRTHPIQPFFEHHSVLQLELLQWNAGMFVGWPSIHPCFVYRHCCTCCCNCSPPATSDTPRPEHLSLLHQLACTCIAACYLLCSSARIFARHVCNDGGVELEYADGGPRIWKIKRNYTCTQLCWLLRPYCVLRNFREWHMLLSTVLCGCCCHVCICEVVCYGGWNQSIPTCLLLTIGLRLLLFVCSFIHAWVLDV